MQLQLIALLSIVHLTRPACQGPGESVRNASMHVLCAHPFIPAHCAPSSSALSMYGNPLRSILRRRRGPENLCAICTSTTVCYAGSPRQSVLVDAGMHVQDTHPRSQTAGGPKRSDGKAKPPGPRQPPRPAARPNRRPRRDPIAFSGFVAPSRTHPQHAFPSCRRLRDRKRARSFSPLISLLDAVSGYLPETQSPLGCLLYL